MTEEQIELKVSKWRHEHFHGKRDCEGMNGEYLERKSQVSLAEYIINNLWISVEDELPECNKEVFVAIQYDNTIDYVTSTRLDKETLGCCKLLDITQDVNGFIVMQENMKVTHWMPIPKIGGEK